MNTQTYKTCVLTSSKEAHGFRVEIKPSAGSKIVRMTTMLFQKEEDAFAEAKKYVDAPGKR